MHTFSRKMLCSPVRRTWQVFSQWSAEPGCSNGLGPWHCRLDPFYTECPLYSCVCCASCCRQCWQLAQPRCSCVRLNTNKNTRNSHNLLVPCCNSWSHNETFNAIHKHCEVDRSSEHTFRRGFHKEAGPAVHFLCHSSFGSIKSTRKLKWAMRAAPRNQAMVWSDLLFHFF